MSKLRVGNDDHPEAASKHFEDMTTLGRAGRHDGAAYLSGYVVECTFKAVLLHDKSYDPTTGTHDPALLTQWHRDLSRRPFGHDLMQLASTTVGPEGARYMPDLPRGTLFRASVLNWSETLRYQASGAVTDATSQNYQQWAEIAHEAILAMRTDGVL